MNTRRIVITVIVASLLTVGGIAGALAHNANASEIEGTVTTLTNDSIVVDDEITVLIDSNTKIEGALVAGSVVEIKARVQEDGKLLATKIEANSETEADEGSEDEEHLELKGTVSNLTDDSFDIGDNTIFIGDSTEVEGELVEGATVEVEAIIQEDGSLLAVEIEVKGDEEHGQSGDEEDVDGDDESEYDEVDDSED